MKNENSKNYKIWLLDGYLKKKTKCIFTHILLVITFRTVTQKIFVKDLFSEFIWEQIPADDHKGGWNPQIWSDRQHWCWEPNWRPLQEQCV